MDLHICFVGTELFAWGMFGGFGAATRMIGGGLAKRGVDVTVVVPAGKGQGRLEELDGMTVHAFPLRGYPLTGHIYREIKADIFHSEEPSWGTKIAMDAVPGSKHVATAQNPKTREDWRRVEMYYPIRRRLYNSLISPSVYSCIKRLDAVYCQAKYIIPKTKKLYDLSTDPGFLPNPVRVPEKAQNKAETPTVCFLGRFDREKGPEIFFELAKEFPDVRFVAAGRANNNSRNEELVRKYYSVANLEFPGFIDGIEKEALLSSSWVLVNTSVSECLPVSFLEAAAHGCAILSSHDPDGFASRFGYQVTGDNFASGLRWLLDGTWKELGIKGRQYVSKVHEIGKVIDQHVAAYERVLSTPRPYP